MQLAGVEQIVRRGAAYLGEALWDYWPTNGLNEMAERNVTLHLGRAFAERNFHVYAETHTEGSTAHHLDLLALHPGEGVLVAIEAKRLHSSEQLDSIVEDANRIGAFRPANESDIEFTIQKRFGALVATTWDDRYAAWWSSKDAEPPSKHRSWSALNDHKLLKDATWGCHVLRAYEQYEQPDRPFHYLLWAVFELVNDGGKR